MISNKVSKKMLTMGLSVLLTGLALTSQATAKQHTVSYGETLSGIANKYNVTQTQLINANGVEVTHLKAGQTINIPDYNDDVVYRVEPGDSLNSLAKKFRVDVRELANVNNIAPDSQLVRGETLVLPEGADLSAEIGHANYPAPNYPQADYPSANYPPNQNPNGQQCVCTPLSNSNANVNVNHSRPSSGNLPANYPRNLSSRHKVTRGETLIQVARDYGVSRTALARANNLPNNARLRIGQVLTIPTASRSNNYAPPASRAPSTYRVRSGDGLIKLANRFNVSLTRLASYNNLSTSAQLKIGQILKIPPEARTH